jgi:hypothetical protein
MTDMVAMELSYSLADRETGLDEYPQNPLARALVTLMEMDKQLPSIRLAFLAEGRIRRPCAGSACSSAPPVTASCSFPASTSISSVRGTEGGVARFDKQFGLGHVSLEKHRGTWHITNPKSKAHQERTDRARRGEDRVVWFGMAVRDLWILRRAKQRTNVTFRVKDKNMQHKLTQLQGAIAGDESVKVPPLPKSPDGSWFPLISNIVGPLGFSLY